MSLAPGGDGGNVEGDVQVEGRNGGYVKGPSLKLKANATMPSQNGVLVHALKEQGDVYLMERLAERHVGYWWPSEGMTRQMILTEFLIEAILSQQHALAAFAGGNCMCRHHRSNTARGLATAARVFGLLTISGRFVVCFTRCSLPLPLFNRFAGGSGE